MKRRRPRPKLEQVGADLLTAYLRSRKSFRSKSTVYNTLSVMRGMGDYLVREGVWVSNPLRWMRGPKVTPYSRLPKRIDRGHMEALWGAAASRRGPYRRHLWVSVLAMLYGTGLRRGEGARQARSVACQFRRSCIDVSRRIFRNGTIISRDLVGSMS
jgi:site-specific recombinase XerD